MLLATPTYFSFVNACLPCVSGIILRTNLSDVVSMCLTHGECSVERASNKVKASIVDRVHLTVN